MNLEHNIEKTPKDVSKEFISMDPFEFSDFLKTLKSEPNLIINMSWVSYEKALALKAFLEKRIPGQTREGSIKATKEQYDEAQNVFASRVKWIEAK